uniref:Ig-like domain-containing protein n=1 Tax=Neogobius melanostomus TaxID=47308 RepID=A0A8C6SX89_9GOBI
SQEVVQLECVKRAKLGDAVVLKCLTHSMWRYRVWYKQATNKTLQHLSSADYKYTPMVTDHRYFTESSAMETNLTILQMTEEDVGTYYCGIFKSRDVVFGSGTVLEIEGESEPVQSVLQSPEYIRAQPGDSVTLSCSFTSSQHQQEHTRVMWVKTGSDSQIISLKYGKENIFCEDTEEASCVHNLTLKDISSAEDGTYLCVVTACGDTLIGNATTIHVNVAFLKENHKKYRFLFARSHMEATVLVLVGVICKMYKRPTKGISDVSTNAPCLGHINYGPGLVLIRSGFSLKYHSQ